MQPYIRSATHEVLCHREHVTLCGDLTGRLVSAYSATYPPDAVFGYMANQLRKGHQAVLVTLKVLCSRRCQTMPGGRKPDRVHKPWIWTGKSSVTAPVPCV
jgi:hypothetical protein